MTKKLTRVSAVAAALALITKLPALATTLTVLSVLSFAATVHIMMLFVPTNELVTVRLVAAAAKLTLPAVLLMV